MVTDGGTLERETVVVVMIELLLFFFHLVPAGKLVAAVRLWVVYSGYNRWRNT